MPLSYRLFLRVMDLAYAVDRRVTGAYYRPSDFGMILGVVLLVLSTPIILLLRLLDRVRLR